MNAVNPGLVSFAGLPSLTEEEHMSQQRSKKAAYILSAGEREQAVQVTSAGEAQCQRYGWIDVAT